MPQPKKPKKPPAKKPSAKTPATTPARAKLIDELVEKLRREERERLGPTSTFEEREDAGFEIMSEVLRKKTDVDLGEQVTDADEVDVDGVKFRRLQQASSATYFSRFGAHHIEEGLYREVGVHNGRRSSRSNCARASSST